MTIERVRAKSNRRMYHRLLFFLIEGSSNRAVFLGQYNCFRVFKECILYVINREKSNFRCNICGFIRKYDEQNRIFYIFTGKSA